MSDMSDRFAMWDAAYVLGALAPGQRREYEEHLAKCQSCQAAVTELAGLPGLLAQVPSEDAALLAAAPAEVLDDGPPPNLLARVRARPAPGRRLVAAVAGVVAAMVLVLTGIAYAMGLLPLGPSQPRRVAFSSVAPTALTAVVDMVPVENGTQLNVECVYGEVGEPRPGGGYAEYKIYVVDRDGRASLVKEWRVKPNKVMRPDGHTTLRVRQIDTVEIRDSATDEPLLRAYLR